MRIKILFAQLSGNFSGSTKALYNLMKYLDYSKYQPVILFARKGDAIEKFRKLGCNVYYYRIGQMANTSNMPLRINKVNVLMVLYFIIRLPIDIALLCILFRKEKIQLVHVNVSPLYSVGIAGYIMRKKITWHIREIFNNNIIKTIQTKLIEKLATVIICISEEVSKSFNNSEKIIIINDGVDIEFIKNMNRNNIRHKLNINNNKIIFIIFGSLAPQKTKLKGFYDFIDAASSIINYDSRNVFFWVLGDSARPLKYNILTNIVMKLFGKQILPERKKLHNYAKLKGVDKYFYFFGFKENVYEYIDSADIVVIPHRVPEAFGLTLIEAGSLKKAVITSNISPTNEIIKHKYTGILVNPADPIGLSKAMIDLLNSREEINRLGNNLYNEVINKYTIEMTSKKINDVCNSVLKNSK